MFSASRGFAASRLLALLGFSRLRGFSASRLLALLGFSQLRGFSASGASRLLAASRLLGFWRFSASRGFAASRLLGFWRFSASRGFSRFRGFSASRLLALLGLSWLFAASRLLGFSASAFRLGPFYPCIVDRRVPLVLPGGSFWEVPQKNPASTEARRNPRSLASCLRKEISRLDATSCFSIRQVHFPLERLNYRLYIYISNKLNLCYLLLPVDLKAMRSQPKGALLKTKRQKGFDSFPSHPTSRATAWQKTTVSQVWCSRPLEKWNVITIIYCCIVASRKLTYPTLGKRKLIFKHALVAYMLVPWRVSVSVCVYICVHITSPHSTLAK